MDTIRIYTFLLVALLLLRLAGFFILSSLSLLPFSCSPPLDRDLENTQQRSEAAGEPLAGGEQGRRRAYDFLDAELRRRTGRTNRGQDVNEVSLFAA
jgi:hypothetical protein